MGRLAAIAVWGTAVCAVASGAAHAQNSPVAIVRSYDTGVAPVAVAPTRARLQLITDYDAGELADMDPANVLPAIAIWGGQPAIVRLGLFTTYDGSHAAPLDELSGRARSLAIVREYDPPAPGDVGELIVLAPIAIVGAGAAEVHLTAIVIAR